MSLKQKIQEKAKTSEEITMELSNLNEHLVRHKTLDFNLVKAKREQKWVRLEDAQKEIDKKDLEIEVLRGNVTLLERQQKELKQKLQHLEAKP